MDGVSVTASILGLIEAARTVASFISRMNDAPSIATAVRTEVNSLGAIFGQVYEFLGGHMKISEDRASMVFVEQLLTTITGCMLAFSDLNHELEGLTSEAVSSGIRYRAMWAWKEKEVQRIMGDLRTHKDSLVLMMSIFTCKSNMLAQNQMKILQENISELLRRSSWKLKGSKNESSPHGPSRRASGIRDSFRTVASSIRPSFRLSISYAFDQELYSSRVYTRAAQKSFPIPFGTTDYWFQLDGLSMSEVSDISVLRIPLQPSDLSNSQLYDFGEPGDRSSVPSIQVAQGAAGSNGINLEQVEKPQEHLVPDQAMQIVKGKEKHYSLSTIDVLHLTESELFSASSVSEKQWWGSRSTKVRVKSNHLTSLGSGHSTAKPPKAPYTDIPCLDSPTLPQSFGASTHNDNQDVERLSLKPSSSLDQPALEPPSKQPVIRPTQATLEYHYRAKARFRYIGNPDDPYELSFEKHEILEVSDVAEKWWHARKANGKTGIIPSNFMLIQDDSNGKLACTNQPSRSNYPFRAKATCSYYANTENPGELSFRNGEVLEVADVTGKWWQVRKANGEMGIVPSTCVIPILSPSKACPYLAKAIRSYSPNPDAMHELSFEKGEILRVPDVTGQWWQAQKANDEMGIVRSHLMSLME